MKNEQIKLFLSKLKCLNLCPAMKSHLGQLSIGSIVSVEVTKVVESGGVLCQLKGNQMKGFVALDNMAGQFIFTYSVLSSVVFL